MDALTLLHQRNSAPKLVEPAPAGEILNDMLKAALRAPDHARLRPWRFLLISGEAREQLGELFAQVAQARCAEQKLPPLTEPELQKLRAKPLRAPLIITVVADIKDHPKVPKIEQLISAGCAAHGILLAAHAQGFAGVWRTGGNAYDEKVREGMGLVPGQEIVGFLYLGSIDGNYKPLPELAIEDYCQSWSGIAD